MLSFPFPNHIYRDFCGEIFELQQWLPQSKDAYLFTHSTIFLVLSNMLSIGEIWIISETSFIIKTLCWHIYCVREGMEGEEHMHTLACLCHQVHVVEVRGHFGGWFSPFTLLGGRVQYGNQGKCWHLASHLFGSHNSFRCRIYFSF